MKTTVIGLILFIAGMQLSFAQTLAADEEIIKLSKDKWEWMAEKNVDTLSKLFHEKAVFVHMGGAWGTEREIDVIKSGGIWYKKADIHEVSVNIVDNTAILLNRIDLLVFKSSRSCLLLAGCTLSLSVMNSVRRKFL